MASSGAMRALVLALLATTLTNAFLQPDDEDLMFDDEDGTKSKWESEAPVAAPWPDAVSRLLPRPRRQVPTFHDDDYGSGSGFEPHTYRIKMHVLVVWTDQFADRTSQRFGRLSRRIRTALETVYRDIGGETTMHVARLSRSQPGRVLALVDVMVTDIEDHRAEVETATRRVLASGKLGDLDVNQRFFEFTEPQGTSSTGCGPSEWQCPAGECVPRCNGVPDCYDASDELGCPDPDDGDSDKLTDGCAGDSIYKCSSGKEICEVQICDGNRDCPDGDDEAGCGCLSGQFLCDTVRCLDLSLKCDGVPDCVDRSDETGCGECPPGQQRCRDGVTCIYTSQFCDGSYNCPSGSDEENCPPPDLCRENQFQCDNGMCIDEFRRCDHIADCVDAEDEASCLTCPEGYFRCFEEGNCINITQRCDGLVQCMDGSDERGCPCKEWQWTCRDGGCIREAGRCDGTIDCADKSDELGCPPSGCRQGQFTCGEGSCIPEDDRCNGIARCPDGSDEEGCPPQQCGPTEFTCRDNTCIPAVRKCDGYRDCPDNSDELNCPPEGCRDDQFTCLDGSCVPLSARCDRSYDCLDRSDEENCPPRCGPGEFACDDGGCISEEAHCDGYAQCRDGSDERGCIYGCRPGELQCGDGSCVPGDSRCDGLRDCRDGTDESGCPTPPVCGPGQWTCRDGSCIPEAAWCDGVLHCYDYSDEYNCPARCQDDEFTCRDGTCVLAYQRCDGIANCPDSSDEDGCAPRPTGCRRDEWTCLDGACIPQISRCDGQYDCLDRSDEQNCPPTPTCGFDDWRCDADGTCLPQSTLCNGRIECSDGSDERNCPTTCKPDEFACADDGTCIPSYLVCDGRPYCRDESDERDCSPACQTGEFRCNDGTCIPDYLVCDGQRYCWDGSDEWECPTCRPDQFRCDDGSCLESYQKCNGLNECAQGEDERSCHQFKCKSGHLIDQQYRCNGQVECPLDQSDEEGCPPCRPDQHLCERDGTCIRKSQVCDSRPDCSDASDEFNCPVPCGRDEWQCSNGQCIPQIYHCDGRQDCSDNSDETVECGLPPPPPTPPNTPRPPRPGSCSANQFECLTGNQCIQRAYKCDGIPDCEDGSDEGERECTPQPCPLSNQFACTSGGCIGLEQRCDGQSDCIDNSDELGCPVEGQCSEDQFTCSDGSCIEKDWLCDEVTDCLGGDDEEKCCMITEFRCGDGTCIPEHFRCDNKFDCTDGSDERDDCVCRPEEFTCNSGECVPNYVVCDGNSDCRDGSDENNEKCNDGELNLRTYPDEQPIKQTQEVVFQCRDEGTRRAPVRWVREGGRRLPPGSTDIRGRLTMPNIQLEHAGTYYCEAQGVPTNTRGWRKPVYLQVVPYEIPTVVPTVVCTIRQATCMSGECIDKDRVCDGRPDCKDSSDEMRCDPNGCEPNEFKCDNRKCVLKTWLCDTDDDCGDGSDEKNCGVTPPGATCRNNEFTCKTRSQCIPKSFHCDTDNDCHDASDEVGCSKPIVVKPPPRNVVVQVSETFTLTCQVLGVPTPIVLWRLNWGHVPSKCEMTSEDGFGTLVCPDAQPTDQGAYSCEAINGKGSVFATPDAIVVVKGTPAVVCQPPSFNSLAVTQEDCLSCFCFGITDKCYSSDMYVTQLPPPNSGSFGLVGANQNLNQGNYVVRDNDYPLSSRHLTRNPPGSQYPDQILLNVDRSKLKGPGDLVVYFSLPDTHKGQQLSSYGGFLHYKIRYSYFGASQTTSHPDIIIRGNNMTLMHVYDGTFRPDVENQVDVRFFYGQWFKRVVQWGGRIQIEQPATREEIMMVLGNMDLLLIRALYTDGDFINTTLSNVHMDTAQIPINEQGKASLVERCICPQGYTGISCQNCAPNYSRVKEGPWLGRCVYDLECGPNEYGDPTNGIECLPCPCPHSNPSNQFSSSCYLANDGQVTCNCRQGYEGRRCQYCASGYEGNPSQAGDYCKPEPVTCMPTFTCLDGSEHPWSRRCDGIKDCFQYEDESDCDVCFNSGHRCDDRRCVHFERICDGHPDCEDRSDEWPENCLDELPCDHIRQWTCADPSRKCIDRSRHCDGYYDCPDNSDERYCNCTCDPSFNFRCSDGTCLDIAVRCNGRIECNDKSDESGCPCNPQTHHTCGDGTCIDVYHVCNGYRDCRDGSDEPRWCSCNPNTMHRCGDGTCIEKSAVCDGRPDCRDFSDEPPNCHQNCDQTLQFACGTGQCIDKRLVCNGYSDCRDGSDEYYCAVCAENQFQCGDRTCVDRRQLCDGQPDCRDQSDEGERAGCCVAPYFFPCGDGNCIESQRVCDGYWDCGDGSDERSCTSQCDPAGSAVVNPTTGYCECKEFATGPRCDQCKADTFYLSEKNSEGCIPCFCMGITSRCSSSNLYRQQEYALFTNDRQGFEVVDSYGQNFIRDDLFVDSGRQELIFQDFPRYGQKVYYWKLPQRFLGNKVTSYGGNLTYTLRFVPAPGGQSSTNNAFDVEIFGNDITLQHFRQGQPSLSPTRQETVSVPLYEQYWQRQSGQEVNREHLMMALADLEHVHIKATYTTATEEVGLKDITLDYAEVRNTGQERAHAVEMCDCPKEYQGSSCEDCAIGYTRSLSGVHLGTCVPCDCSGHSTECDPNTGICFDCKNNTAGNYCELCAPGYNRYGDNCYPDNPSECVCDPRGNVRCERNRCQCKAHVTGTQCDSCRPGYFHLSADNPAGCLPCWCSGASSQCFSSNYYREQIPMQLLSNHGFTFSNRLQTDVIQDGFNINLANNEISFSSFDNLRPRETYFWSLPQLFTGNRLESYGGNLTVTQRFQTQPGGNTYSEADVIIRSTNGREFIWMTQRPLQQNIEQTYIVQLTEDSFTMNQQPASRSEFLQALSSVEAILIRATLSEQMSATFLSDVVMDTAVPRQTGQPRALEVEQCRCPMEYSGLSCEMCRPGYYRSAASNRCIRCPCNGREASCAERPDGGVQCECLPGYYGPSCEHSGLMLELKPIKVLFSRQARQVYENFTCSFHSTEPLRLAITREPTWVGDGAPAPLMDSQPAHLIKQYAHGAKYFSVLRLLRGHRTVTCRVFDASNKQVAQMSSRILYGSREWMAGTPDGGREQPAINIEVTISEPSIKVVTVNSTVQLSCSARSVVDSQARISVTWNKAGGELPYGRARDNRQGLLVITEVRPTDSGVYICAAVDEYGRVVTDNVTLTVSRERPNLPNVILEPQQGSIDVGVSGSLVVRCSVEGSRDAQVFWTYGPNRPLPTNVYQQNGVLTFRDAQQSDSGEYYCTSTNAYGQGIARIYINVVTVTTITVQVSSENVVTTAGETVRVACSAGSSPGSLTIEWSRVSGLLPTQAVVERGELQIPSAQPADSGTYVCRITDRRTSQYNEASTRITITEYRPSLPQIQPTVLIQPDRQTINQGTNAELLCRVTGDPPPVVTWTKANEQHSSRVTIENNILRITNAQVSDRGMYVCTATNQGGSAQAAAIIEVERREPPQIQMHPAVRQTIDVGGSALFQCHLTAGIPSPTVQWTRTDGQQITANTEILSGGVLRFNQVRGDEAGSYLCTAENAVGSATAVATLEIQSLPTIDIRPGPSPYTVNVGERVQFECIARGDPAPSVSWKKLQVNFPTAVPSVSRSPGVAVYEIASVSKADEGTYMCSAENSAGINEKRLQLLVEDGSFSQRLPPLDDNKTIYVPAGSPYEFICSGTGPDAQDLQFTFRRSDNRPLPAGARTDEGTLYLPAVDETASGEYACVASDRISGVIRFTIYTTIRVLVPPRISLDPARQVVRPGEVVRIRCSATGPQPITINWSKEVGRMPASVVINGGELTFRGIATTDAGRYICTAQNNAGTTRAVAEVVVNAYKGSTSTYPTISEGLYFDDLEDGDDEYDYESSTPADGYYLHIEEEIMCKFICHNRTLCISPSEMCDGKPDCPDGEDEESCFFDSLIPNDIFDNSKCSDFFKCGDGSCYFFFLNCNGECDCNDCKDEKICLRRRRDTPHEEPLVTATEPRVTLYVGQTAELRCETSGINPNDVRWTRVGGRLPPGASARGNILRLPLIELQDRGEYQCEAILPSGQRLYDIVTLVVQRESWLPRRSTVTTRNNN